jgi:hypothetical protein
MAWRSYAIVRWGWSPSGMDMWPEVTPTLHGKFDFCEVQKSSRAVLPPRRRGGEKPKCRRIGAVALIPNTAKSPEPWFWAFCVNDGRPAYSAATILGPAAGDSGTNLDHCSNAEAQNCCNVWAELTKPSGLTTSAGSSAAGTGNGTDCTISAS